MPQKIIERDSSGYETAQYNLSQERDANLKIVPTSPKKARFASLNIDWRGFARSVFLPAGYPATVSQDYLEVQIYYGLQAFCSSLAGLVASRAVLEGHGIGKAEASATHAVLLTVLQDAFSRLATIIGAYYLGTLLYPEAKTYRLVADVTNDIAIVFDLLSPQLSAFSLSTSPPFLIRSPGILLRTVALCLSGAFRALCGVAAGSSRAAITLHFAQDGSVPGDLGDLSAKDASKETVYALIGMLCGSMLMPYLNTQTRTYTVVSILLGLHILANYVAVRVVVMKSLNRQRASILWAAYSERRAVEGNSEKTEMTRKVLTPSQVALREHLFGCNSSLLQYHMGRAHTKGRATIGSPLSSLLHPDNADPSFIHKLLELFSDKPFMIGLDTRRGILNTGSATWLSIVLKGGHDSKSHLEAWILAALISASITPDMSHSSLLECMEACKEKVDRVFDEFVTALRQAGWRVDMNGILTGSPKMISVQGSDDRKRK